MDIQDTTRTAVEDVIRSRFGPAVRTVTMEPGQDAEGDDILLIRVEMGRDTGPDVFKDTFFGLTDLVRQALGERFRGIFPVIRPVEHAG